MAAMASSVPRNTLDETPRAGQPLRAAQTSIKNWFEPAIRTNDGRSNPSAGWETAPLFSSSLGGQKKMIMVEEPPHDEEEEEEDDIAIDDDGDDDGETRRE